MGGETAVSPLRNKTMTRAEILETARNTVCGHREQDYGTPEDNFAVIAAYWEVYLNGKSDPLTLTPADVANMMCLFKIGRITTGTGTEDSYIDLAGYAACGAEITTENKEGGCNADYCTIN